MDEFTVVAKKERGAAFSDSDSEEWRAPYQLVVRLETTAKQLLTDLHLAIPEMFANLPKKTAESNLMKQELANLTAVIKKKKETGGW